MKDKPTPRRRFGSFEAGSGSRGLGSIACASANPSDTAPLLGMKPSQLSPGRVTYDLRRLHLHGLIERIPKTHRYRITAKGLRTAIFYTRLYNRSLRTGLAVISPDAANANIPLARSIRAAEAALNTWYDKQNLAA